MVSIDPSWRRLDQKTIDELKSVLAELDAIRVKINVILSPYCREHEYY